MVIDAHCHIYPPKIAERATSGVGDFYQIPMAVAAGTPECLAASLKGTPIARACVHSVATSARQVASINDFIAQTCALNPQFTGFMTLHQDTPDPEAEIKRCLAAGLRGIKLHPDSQRVNMDDARLMTIYEIAAARDLPLIVHCGDYRYDYSHPRRMKKVLKAFPDLRVDAAHFGGWSIFDVAVDFLKDERCFMDLSSSMKFLGPTRTRELIRIYGADRIMFGSDFPMWSPAGELSTLQACGLKEDELEKVCSKTALRFLNEI